MRIISPQKLQQRIASGDSVCLLDVRTPAEYASSHIEQATLRPLERFDAATFAKEPVDAGSTVYVICQSGARARSAIKELEAAGLRDCVLVEGGMSAWMKAGFDVEQRAKGVISLERQVRIGAGFLVLCGTLLGVFVHPALLAVPGLVGAGLMFAGISDICGMGMLLAKMPWNQAKAELGQDVCCGRV
jgi:rhodanese-related sulfurtransferase